MNVTTTTKTLAGEQNASANPWPIFAAPDLLAALKAMLEQYRDVREMHGKARDSRNPVLDKATAAIAKAEGQTFVGVHHAAPALSGKNKTQVRRVEAAGTLKMKTSKSQIEAHAPKKSATQDKI